ncbi:hypothetical protein ACFL16_01220 [Patescibacteria group bacterium]
MPLKKIEKELYKDESEELEKRKLSEDYFDPEKAKEEAGEKFEERGEWEEQQGAKITRYSKKTVFIGIAVVSFILILFVVMAGVVRFKQGSFSEERVTVKIEGDERVRSSELIKYKISYENDNRAALRGAEIRLDHSQNFVVDNSDVEFRKEGDNNTIFSLGEIGSHDKKEIEVEGRFYAPEDFTVYLKPKLRYTPSNFNSVFENEFLMSVEVATAPISMSVVAPNEALETGMVEYLIEYENLSEVAFRNLKIEAEYPEGFTYNSASVNPSQGNNIWYIDNIEAGQKGSFTVSGNVAARSGDIKIIKVALGLRTETDSFVLYNKKEDVTRIVSSPLYVRHTVNDSKSLNVDLGERMRYFIEFGNKGDKGLRDNVIVLNVDSDIIDFERLVLVDGHYDSGKKTITWRASDISELNSLAPGQKASIRFEIPVKERIEISSSDDENFDLNSRIRIDSNDVSYHALGPAEAYSDEVVVKLNSKVVLESLAYRTNSVFENIGPIPPKVGEETSYTLHWKLTNISNDIDNVEIRSYLATGVRWLNKISPSDADVSFNSRTNEVVWNAGKVENGKGVLNEPLEVIFQISIIPEVNQVDENMELSKDVMLTGRDLFTGSDINASVSGETSRISIDDPAFENVNVKVVP